MPATDLKFFDCNCAFGPYRTQVFRFSRTADELLEEMDFSNIDRALVYHTTMRFDHPQVGNPRVLEETSGRPRLMPTWSLLPSQTGEQPPIEKLIADMREHNVRALRLFVDDHRYFLDETTWGDQMAVFAERRIPVFIRASLDRIAVLLRAFPSLVVVTASQGSNPLDRYAWPLVERFPSLLFETSGYIVDAGIEEFCNRYSASRLIFGTGYPDNSSGSAMLALAHADLSDAQKRQIAGGNLSRRLEEASLG